MSVDPENRRPPSLRSENGLLLCSSPRRKYPLLPCDAVISRPTGPSLVIRCKNCKHDHVFGIRNGRIVPLDEDDPEFARATRPKALPVMPTPVR